MTYRLPTTTAAGRRQRTNRIKYRISRAGVTYPSVMFVLVFGALIAFHVITLSTGIAHYEFHGIFSGFDYSFDLGGFHYHYGKGFGHYDRSYRIG